MLSGKDMKDSITETGEILVAEGISFKNFNFIITAFGKAIGDVGI